MVATDTQTSLYGCVLDFVCVLLLKLETSLCKCLLKISLYGCLLCQLR